MPTFTLTRAESLLYAAFNLLAIHQSRAISATELADYLCHKTRHAITRMARRLEAKNLLGLHEEGGDIWLTRLPEKSPRDTHAAIAKRDRLGALNSRHVTRRSAEENVLLTISQHAPLRYAQAVSKPIREVERVMLDQLLPNNPKAQFLFLNVDLIQRQLAYCLSLFEKNIHLDAQIHYLMRLVSQYASGQPIKMNQISEGDHHISRHVLNKTSEIAIFFDAFMAFVQGSPADYIAWLASINKQCENQ